MGEIGEKEKQRFYSKTLWSSVFYFFGRGFKANPNYFETNFTFWSAHI